MTLRAWHQARYKPYAQVPFLDRTLGDLLEEFYFDLAMTAEELRGQVDDLDPAQLERLSKIEEMLMDERNVLSGLSDADSREVWKTAHVTGDPLVDRWERELADDNKIPDMDEVV